MSEHIGFRIIYNEASSQTVRGVEAYEWFRELFLSRGCKIKNVRLLYPHTVEWLPQNKNYKEYLK